jgi:hypothetical protein
VYTGRNDANRDANSLHRFPWKSPSRKVALSEAVRAPHRLQPPMARGAKINRQAITRPPEKESFFLHVYYLVHIFRHFDFDRKKFLFGEFRSTA